MRNSGSTTWTAPALSTWYARVLARFRRLERRAHAPATRLRRVWVDARGERLREGRVHVGRIGRNSIIRTRRSRPNGLFALSANLTPSRSRPSQQHEIQELLKELRVVGVANDADRYLVKKLMHELGRDEDGVIDFEEFKVRRAHSLSPRRQLGQLGEESKNESSPPPARPISHWSPYDRVGDVDADP